MLKGGGSFQFWPACGANFDDTAPVFGSGSLFLRVGAASRQMAALSDRPERAASPGV
jgi:hypothetical protein